MTSRQFHRWAGLAAALIFFVVSITGVVLQSQKILGDEEINKEEMEQTASSQKLTALLATTLDAARDAVAARYSDATVGSVNWQFKGEPPLIVFHLEGPTHLRVSVDATTSHIVKTESDEESWVRRLHSGELLGEAGKYLGLLGGIALIGMTITGLVMYSRMMQGRNKTGQHIGLKRWFWVALFELCWRKHLMRDRQREWHCSMNLPRAMPLERRLWSAQIQATELTLRPTLAPLAKCRRCRSASEIGRDRRRRH